jgi:hypothetical protein
MNSESHVFGSGTNIASVPAGNAPKLSHRIDQYLVECPDSTIQQIADGLAESIGAVRQALRTKTKAGEVVISGTTHGAGGARLRYCIADGTVPQGRLTTVETMVREFLADHPAKTPAQIAEAIGVHKSAAQKAIEILGRKKQVTVVGLLREPKKPPQKKFVLWDGTTHPIDPVTPAAPIAPPAPIAQVKVEQIAQAAPEPEPDPQPIASDIEEPIRIPSDIEAALHRIQTRLQRPAVDPVAIRVLLHLEQILEPSIAAVLRDVRQTLGSAA